MLEELNKLQDAMHVAAVDLANSCIKPTGEHAYVSNAYYCKYMAARSEYYAALKGNNNG